MELRFVPPDLRQLDLLVSEIIAVPIAAGDRPAQSSAGLLDYRLGGRISQILYSGALQGNLGDKVFVPGRPTLPYDKIFLYGIGERNTFNSQTYVGIIDMLLSTFSRMGMKRAVVELPGRADDLISPEIAAQVLLERASHDPHLDTWTLIESGAAQRKMNSLAAGSRNMNSKHTR